MSALRGILGPDDAWLAAFDPAHDRLAGGARRQALVQRLRQGCEHRVRERVAVEGLMDHLGVDESEVGDARAGFVVAELHPQCAAELLNGGLAHRIRRGAGMAESAGTEPGHEGREMLEAMTLAIAGAYESLSVWWREHPDIPPEQLADWLLDLLWPGLEGLITQLAASP